MTRNNQPSVTRPGECLLCMPALFLGALAVLDAEQQKSVHRCPRRCQRPLPKEGLLQNPVFLRVQLLPQLKPTATSVVPREPEKDTQRF